MAQDNWWGSYEPEELTPSEKADEKSAMGYLVILAVILVVAATTNIGQAILEFINSSNLP